MMRFWLIAAVTVVGLAVAGIASRRSRPKDVARDA
jgi:hypothetical protein